MIGVVERGGKVVARVANPGDLSAKGISKFIARFVDKAGTMLITDEYKGYNPRQRNDAASVISTRKLTLTATFTRIRLRAFGRCKRAWYGTHHHYSRKYMPLYIAESCYKYNRRTSKTAFADSMRCSWGRRHEHL